MDDMKAMMQNELRMDAPPTNNNNAGGATIECC